MLICFADVQTTKDIESKKEKKRLFRNIDENLYFNIILNRINDF